MFRNENALNPIAEDEIFDLVIVGSGNGACGFLSECLKHVPCDYNILLLELGTNFFYTSDITHQNGWSKTYATSDIYKLHNTVTPDGRSVLSGRANTMGGGGSINYTMIHESSEWLTKQVGHDVDYWEKCKQELNCSFKRPNPFGEGYQTPFAKFIAGNAEGAGYATANEARDMIANIPSYFEKESKQLYLFPTQFDRFGSRTNSGVSLFNWEKIKYRWNTEVTGLVMEKSGMIDSFTCTGVETKNTKTGLSTRYNVKKGTGRVILCGGSQSPRLLLNTEELAKNNEKIGKRVNDHICMPLGIYFVEKEQASMVGPTDNYESLFAITNVLRNVGHEVEEVPVNIDFFSGEILRMIYLVSSLYLCYIPFNMFKRFMGRNPIVYTYLSNTIRIILTGIIYLIRVFPCSGSLVLTTALVKFNAAQEGYYEKEGDKIILRFFDDDSDVSVAESAINDNINFFESNGRKPNFFLRVLFQFLTKIPYKKGREVSRYVRHFSRKTLLSEQHLAGGCLFGDAIDKGMEDRTATGKVFGSTNIHVADLSTVPLPRVSTQMTAYIIGHHVAKQLFSPELDK